MAIIRKGFFALFAAVIFLSSALVFAAPGDPPPAGADAAPHAPAPGHHGGGAPPVAGGAGAGAPIPAGAAAPPRAGAGAPPPAGAAAPPPAGAAAAPVAGNGAAGGVDPTTLAQINPIVCPANNGACPEYSTCDTALGICQADECYNEFVAECPLGFNCNMQMAAPNVADAGTCQPVACGTVQTNGGCPDGFNCVQDICTYIQQ